MAPDVPPACTIEEVRSAAEAPVIGRSGGDPCQETTDTEIRKGCKAS